MDVDEELRGSKRKRAVQREYRERDSGEEEKEDEEEDEGEKRKPKRRTRPQGPLGNRRNPLGMGRFFDPPCLRCTKSAMACKEQAGQSACCRCAKLKVKCIQGSGVPKRKDTDDDGMMGMTCRCQRNHAVM
jgi:hypothetical protein